MSSFEEMRGQIENDLKKQQAQRKFAEVADAFTNGVYEQSDSLKPVAERLQLDIRTASNLMRTPAPGATGVLAHPKLLSAIFSPDAVEKKRNTEAVETAPNQLVSARIVQYSPARTRPFAEVKDAVRARLLAERGAELARKEGAIKLAAWRASPTSAELPAAVVVSREQTAAVAPKADRRSASHGSRFIASICGRRSRGPRVCDRAGQQDHRFRTCNGGRKKAEFEPVQPALDGCREPSLLRRSEGAFQGEDTGRQAARR